VILSGLRVATSATAAVQRDIVVPSPLRDRIDASGYIALPGLINAHDHLEFNLYPRLGRGPYRSSREWANDIYHPDRDPVRRHQKVPKAIRLRWGGLKNLLNGVTTVCHHNCRDDPTLDDGFPVRVLKRFGWAHSIEFSMDVRELFRGTPRTWPFIIHLGESTNDGGRREIFQLDAMGALDRRTVLVHGVGLDIPGLALVRERRASVIWCPSSNLFMLGRTIDATALLRDNIPVALGSDSSLTAAGDLIDELQVARQFVDPPTLYHMVTEIPREMLVVPRRPGDVILFADHQSTPADTLVSGARPDLVLIGGRVALVSDTFKERLPQSHIRGLFRFRVCDKVFYCRCNVADLCRKTAAILGSDFRLAGRKVEA
jgi:cytosine/adenosine deaminase-related metal-dependent hydrolase